MYTKNRLAHERRINLNLCITDIRFKGESACVSTHGIFGGKLKMSEFERIFQPTQTTETVK